MRRELLIQQIATLDYNIFCLQSNPSVQEQLLAEHLYGPLSVVTPDFACFKNLLNKRVEIARALEVSDNRYLVAINAPEFVPSSHHSPNRSNDSAQGGSLHASPTHQSTDTLWSLGSRASLFGGTAVQPNNIDIDSYFKPDASSESIDHYFKI